MYSGSVLHDLDIGSLRQCSSCDSEILVRFGQSCFRLSLEIGQDVYQMLTSVKTSSSVMRTEEVFERFVRSRNPLVRVNSVSSDSTVDIRSTVEGHVAGR